MPRSILIYSLPSVSQRFNVNPQASGLNVQRSTLNFTPLSFSLTAFYAAPRFSLSLRPFLSRLGSYMLTVSESFQHFSSIS
jgi:hypothetical protein